LENIINPKEVMFFAEDALARGLGAMIAQVDYYPTARFPWYMDEIRQLFQADGIPILESWSASMT
jgi:hypothetical protein